MIGWRARLAARRAARSPAVSAEGADRSGAPPGAPAFCTNGTSGNAAASEMVTAQPDPIAARIAFYLRATQEAAEALAAPDPEFDAERAVMAWYYMELGSLLGQADEPERLPSGHTAARRSAIY